MLIINIDKESKIPVFRQIIEEIINKIKDGTLYEGYKLPSSRSLAKVLGLNRSTVYKAYQELWALGYTESMTGAFTTIRDKRQINGSVINPHKKDPLAIVKLNKKSEELFNSFQNIGNPFSVIAQPFIGIDFSLLHPDKRLYPNDLFRKALNKTLLKNPYETLDYGDSQGYAPLKEFISDRMRLHDINTDASNVLITNGAQNAIDLLCKLLINKNDRVFVESPTYGMILQTLKFYDCSIVQIPITEHGIDLNILQDEINKGLPAFIYTMPNFHNPTGITATQEQREKLIELCKRYNIPIIEDAFEEEMKYFGKVPLPIKSMNLNNIVFYIGSFSKVLFPGIRIGWITAAQYYINRLTVLKRCSDMSTTLPIQAALYEFCKEGNYELHIKRIHKIYRKRMLLAIDLMNLHFDKNIVNYIEPNGGFTIWITFKNTNYSYTQLESLFNSYNIRLTGGHNFYINQPKEKSFRLSISQLNENEIENGIKNLAKAIKEIK
ncbi:MAG TPA: PLP-dependent aminotransferase family protein [Melioribacteraceae bacterium]|nr:PLP-dependent aminotransferase family protein [Melioribacteraceae bacterium]